MKQKRNTRYFFVGIFTFGLSIIILDILFLLFGGRYLAWQVVPPLPEYTKEFECFSQHTVRCQNISYETPQSPQEVMGQWLNQTEVPEFDFKDTTWHHLEVCNESWLGLHYAFFHKNQYLQDLACANLSVRYNTSKMTEVVIQTSWSMCPFIINELSPTFMNRYFRCYTG